jgi:hypothetical protein
MFNVQQAVTCELSLLLFRRQTNRRDRKRCWNEEKNDTNKQSTATRKSQIRKFADFNNLLHLRIFRKCDTLQKRSSSKLTYWKPLHLLNTSSYQIVCLLWISTILCIEYLCMVRNAKETSITIFCAKCMQCASRYVRGGGVYYFQDAFNLMQNLCSWRGLWNQRGFLKKPWASKRSVSRMF